MNPAQKIIKKFGGQTSLAKLLSKSQPTIQHWSVTGTIPSKWHVKIIEVALKRGISLEARDFLPEKKESSKLPEAKWMGGLVVDELQIPCYVLDDGRRIISRTGATNVLTSSKGGGNLESYTGIDVLKKYMPSNLSDQMIEFTLEGVVNKTVRGMNAETFLDICRAYSKARDDRAPLTDRQLEIAIKANMFLMACSKIGIIALIDEATGYQYVRTQDALRFKLAVYLEDEMRKWEKTFPDELWQEFGRLTNWKGSVNQRPRYWGKLVMELVYDYLDKDVADWLRENAPSPRSGKSYHQWLSSQYGLKKLVEHLWMLIGMARACSSMHELRSKMAEQFGRQSVQLNLFLPPPNC